MFHLSENSIFKLVLLAITCLSLDAFAAVQTYTLQAQLSTLEASSSGRLGVAAINTGNNQRIQYRANEYFPMGCTSKVIGVAAILKKSMMNNQLLQERIMYKKMI